MDTSTGLTRAGHPALTPRVRLPRRTLIAIAGTELVTLGSVVVPTSVGLALAIDRIDTGLEPESALSIVTALGAVAALATSPIFGALSDRTRNRGHGRASFLLGGVVAGGAAIVLLLLADSVAMLALTWVLALTAYTATFSALYGLMADLVHESDRPRVSGWFGAAAVGSVVVGMGLVAVLPKTPGVVMLTMPALSLPVAAWSFRHLGRIPRPVAPAARARLRRFDVAALRGNPQFWLVWLQRLLVQMAHGVVTFYGLYYLIRRVGLPVADAATWVAAATATGAVFSVVASLVGGSLAARRGSYGPYLVLSVGLIAAALVLKGVGTSTTAFLVATILTGVGIGCYYAVDLALALRAVPTGRAGLFLGLFNVARTLPGSLVPSVAPALLAIGAGDVIGRSGQNYAALYAAGLVVALVSLLPLRWMTLLQRDRAADVSRSGTR